MDDSTPNTAAGPELPPEEWAQVEVFGHRRHFGRVAEVERFGAKMLRIDVPTADAAVFETLFYGGGSIFSVTPCTEEAARQWAERLRPRPYQPSARLPPPDHDDPGNDGNPEELGEDGDGEE